MSEPIHVVSWRMNAGDTKGLPAATKRERELAKSYIKTLTTLSAEQVHEIVQELRGANYQTVGQEFFVTRAARLYDAGWVLGVTSFPQKMTHGRRGHLLRTPKNEWRNLAYFFNRQQMVKVWYWNNSATNKQHALDLASLYPAPAGTYITFNKSK